MEKFWVDNLHYLIKGYANHEEQQRVWLGFDNSIVSSYTEDFTMLFDDNEFDDFIKEWGKENLDKKVLKELVVFRDKLNDYNKKLDNVFANQHNYWPDKYVLEDPEWLNIVNQAKKIIDIWVI